MQLTDVGTKRSPIIDEVPNYLGGQVLEQLMIDNSSDLSDEVIQSVTYILMVQSDLRPVRLISDHVQSG